MKSVLAWIVLVWLMIYDVKGIFNVLNISDTPVSVFLPSVGLKISIEVSIRISNGDKMIG